MDHYGKQGSIGLNYANSANVQAQQVYADAPPRNRSSLDEISGRLAGAVQQLSLLSEGLSTLEGRLMGGCSLAGNAKDAGTRPMPSGFVGQTNMVMDELFARIEACGHLVARLSDAI